MRSLQLLLRISFVFVTFICLARSGKYEPTWDSLDTRPIPKWFDDAKIGLMMHWGVYSVPAYGSEWIWPRLKHLKYRKRQTPLKQFMMRTYKENTTYAELAPMFTASLFDAKQWAALFKKSGVKYVVLTAKHVDGFTLWPSRSSPNWNSMQVGPKRDLVGELGTAVKNASLKYGVYYSLYEWHNYLMYRDYRNWWKTNYYVETKIQPELKELVKKYKPDVLWSLDTAWMSSDYLKSKEFLAWLYNKSPVKDSVVVNDRWGAGTMCRHGSFFSCATRDQPNHQCPHKWETAVSLDRSSWGYNRLSKSSNYLTIEEILAIVARVVSDGGNVMFNVGPTHDGRIPPIMEQRLIQLGEWLDINGEAIYKTKAWKHRIDSKVNEVYYTQSKAESDTIFAIILKPPKDNILRLGSVKMVHDVEVLRKNGSSNVIWKEDENGNLEVKLPAENTKWFPVLKISTQDP